MAHKTDYGSYWTLRCDEDYVYCAFYVSLKYFRRDHYDIDFF